MIGRIHSDIFFQDRYVLNEVNVKVRLVRNKDAFCLMSGEANPSYRVNLISTVLIVRKVQLSPSVFLAHAKALDSGLAKYPIKRVICKTYTFPAANLDGNHEKLVTGQLSSRLVIGWVDNDAFNGNYVKRSDRLLQVVPLGQTKGNSVASGFWLHTIFLELELPNSV